MRRRTRITNTVVLIPGLLLGCCWLPRGVSGILSLARIVSPTLRAPDMVVKLLRLWADTIGRYGVLVIEHAREICPDLLACRWLLPTASVA